MTEKQYKKCKGTGKAKTFGCNESKVIFKYGLCYECYKDFLFNSEQGKTLVKRYTLKAKKDVKRQNNIIKKEQKQKLKTKTQLINEARKYFQRFIRLRDKNQPCISCSTTTTNLWDGGHFYKAELYSGLIFNEENCHKQCRKCNRYLGGNETNYRKGLIKRYGKDYVKALDEKALTSRSYDYSRTEIEEIKNKYKNLIKNRTEFNNSKEDETYF